MGVTFDGHRASHLEYLVAIESLPVATGHKAMVNEEEEPSLV